MQDKSETDLGMQLNPKQLDKRYSKKESMRNGINISGVVMPNQDSLINQSLLNA